MKITVCTLAINDWYFDIVRYAIRHLQEYCKNNNYTCVIDYGINDTVYDEIRQEPWYKILLIEKLLKESDSDYIVWIDADCQILKPEIKLEYFIEKYFQNSHEIVLTEDTNTFNTGIMFIKNSEFSRSLMRRIWNNTDGDYFKNFHEQTSFADIYLTDNIVREKVKVIRYGEKDELVVYWGNYYPGKNFILHSAKCSFDKLGFMYTMDLFYIHNLDEETNEEFHDRLNWINSIHLSRAEIDSWIRQEYRPRKYSARCLEFIKNNTN